MPILPKRRVYLENEGKLDFERGELS